MIRRRSASKPVAAALQHSPASKRSVSYSMAFPLPVAGTPPAAKRRPLQTQHLGLAAVDAGYCCHEPTQLHLNVEWRLDRHVVGGVLENATGQLLFEVREKPLSLHRQRSLLDVTEVPVATIRMSAFRRRKATYSAYPRAESSKKPLFKFSMARSKLEMEFTDIMTGHNVSAMDMHEVASKVQTLVALRHFVAAFDAGQVASKPTQLRVRADSVVNTATRETLFLVQQKQYSLHRQRTLLDARNELPVATLRLSMFNRTPTYSAYPRTEHEETPCAFKFTADDTTVRSEFTDLVGGQHCTIGCDPPADGSDSLAFWLVRGSGDSADVQQTIARLTYTHKSPKTKEEQSVLLDVAPGVDCMMMILICIGLLDEGFEDEHTHPQ
uniref:Tubby C-terminal domain-containing protein n=2 Tax=Phytophthora ramorum TaxID=164328 RepID=H3GGK0_PHYRM